MKPALPNSAPADADGLDLAAQLHAYLWPLATGGDEALWRRTLTMLCEARDRGDVCLPLRERASPTDGEAMPALATWREQLLATGLVGTGADNEPELPLVLDDGDRLYLRRHFRAERTIAAFVRARLAAPALVDAAALRVALDAVGLAAHDTAPDWQLAAVAAAARCSFSILCGGPGTGKTTTVAKMLAVLLQLQPELRIAVAAPTGKAAARLGEALRQRAGEFPALTNALPTIKPRTLHRLLAYLPLDDLFRNGPDRRIPYDVVVVDEASMVDAALLAALVAALPPHTRLVLVGDQDQLAAVAAGQVLGDLCRAAKPERGVGTELAAFVREATGMQLPVQQRGSPLADVTIALRENHRFGKQPGIGAFATALMQRDADAAWTTLHAGHDDLQRVPDRDAGLQTIAPALQQMLEAARTGDPAAALAGMGRARVLTASRHGPHGAFWWNGAVEAWLAEHGHRADDPWYVGRPILITSNDHQNQIWNGDLGVVGRDDHGNAVVWLVAADGNPRAFSPRRLPPHETAWAMTVHKAQGSEFDDVLLSMPDGPGPLWQATLVYTGITRARRRAVLLADEGLLRPCLANWPQRSSGLVEAIGGGGA